MAATVLAGNPAREKELRDAADGDLPWTPKRLARMGASAVEGATSEQVINARSRNIYAAYKWLCKLKHPTIRSALHDSAASGASDGTFVVMSAPDLRIENLPVKRLILLLSCDRVIEAVKRFASALQRDQTDEPYHTFSRQVARAESVLLNVARSDEGPLPFGLTPRDL